MRKFYYNHIDFITEGAVVPDLRRGLLNDKNESPRHYIDIEDFSTTISAFPKTSKEAYKKYDSTFSRKSCKLEDASGKNMASNEFTFFSR